MRAPYEIAPPAKLAFSLVELSIVLVILGLLVGGTLTGRSLIRAAELRSVTTEYQKYYTAVKSFREKYFALPGDMTNATQFWGEEASPSNGGACQGGPFSASPSKKTCDGDGNGKIEYASVSEPLRLWQHLENSGLIPAFRYSGKSDDDYCYLASACPKAKAGNRYTLWSIDARVYDGGMVAIFATGSVNDLANLWSQYGNSIWLGSTDAGVRVMTGQEMYNIDTKIDDGKPARGKVVVVAYSNVQQCTTTNVATNLDAEYLLDSSSLYNGSRKYCSIIFRQQF